MPIRKILAVGLVFGSAFLALLIFLDKPYKLQLESDLSGARFEDPSLLTSSFGKTEPAVEELSQKIVKEIIKLNPEGPVRTSGISQINALEPSKMVEEILAQEFTSIDYEDFIPKINLDSIKVIAGLDGEATENYFKNFRAILENNLDDKNYNLQNTPIEVFGSLVAIYQKTISQFYSLTVPEPLVEIHIREIALLSIQKSIFESLADYEKSPFKALVALQLLDEVDKKFNQLAQVINNFTKENNINF